MCVCACVCACACVRVHVRVYIRVCVSRVILGSLVFAIRVDIASFEALSRVLLSRTMRACACLGYLAAALAVVALSCDGGVVEDECYQLLLAPVDT